MKVPVTEKNDFTRLIFECPECRAKTQFKIVWYPSQAVLTQIHGHITRYVLRCTACGEHIFLHTRRVEVPFPTESNIETQFPPTGHFPHPSIPAEIATDLREAAICISIGAWNAATVMCRRSLQSCAKEKGANPKDNLFDQLKELKDQNLIPDLVYQMADTIRKKGNVGAHPGKDPIVNVSMSEKEAKAVFSLVESVYKYVYQMPSEVNALSSP
jgi:hypothetical protein